MQKRNKKGEELVYYYKLREEIRKSGYTQEMLAKELNISTSTLNQKMNNKTSFRISEALKICELLDIDLKRIREFFY
nr:MAG TPA: helix-turn-helix domain protein [Caudoviricetes sp.]